MSKRVSSWVLSWLMAMTLVLATAGAVAAQVRTATGLVEGTTDQATGVRSFLGIPFAAPPVGDLRWKAPAPPQPWDGTRQTTAFGHRCMQGPIFGDMIFRDEVSEDCLYLNVWTPARSADERLPVMVWIYGGGFQAGSASEPRQDGGHLAQKDVVVVSFNYRLGVFGFFAHPELTAESPHKASGNYGLLDQVAALQWVQKNIAAFGGNPNNVTIFGESAGSFSVSALMASPLAKGLFAKAIGESGAFFTAGPQTLAPKGLAASEQAGATFAQSMGAASLADLRSKPGDAVLQAALKGSWFSPNVDGYMLPADAFTIFSAGKQNDVPLLAGWNADEVRGSVTLGKEKTTAESFAAQVKKRFSEDADAILEAYPASSDGQAIESAASLASDLFIGYSTWKWVEMQKATGHSPVYVYSFDRKIPIPPDTKVNGVTATSSDIGARHAGEIEYVFGTLDSVPKVTWQPEDRRLSDLMMTCWTNFARSGDPSSAGVPKWPAYAADQYQVMHLDGERSAAMPDARRPRYAVLDAMTEKLRGK
jgi:para-nitrobenzyl esterase